MKQDELKFIPLTMPQMFSLIPKRLFEQLDGAAFKVKNLYEYGPHLIASGCVFIYVLADDNNEIHGLLWMQHDILSDELFIPMLSVDKDYQQDFLATRNPLFDKCLDKAREIISARGLSNRIRIVTKRPKAYVRAGWKESEMLTMEMEL